MSIYADEALRAVIRLLTMEWGSRPRAVLACQDAEDEHWQIFNMDDQAGPDGLMPRYVIDKDGRLEVHTRYGKEV